MAPMCFTRVPKDGVVNNTGHDKWGYCSKECKGQVPDTNSSFNLARPQYNQIWEERFFDLRNFGSGYCYTYNPPQTTDVDFTSRLFMLLGRNALEQPERDLFIGVELYLHEKGQFWPRPNMDIIGQTQPIMIPVNQQVQGEFSIKNIAMIKRKAECTDSYNYSYTGCLLKYVEDSLDCKINWNSRDEGPVKCTKNVKLKDYYDVLLSLQHLPTLNITKMSGCLPRCRYTQYDYQLQLSEEVTWQRNWLSSLYLMPKYAGTHVAEEKYEFGLSDLVSDVGSYLGLFLGWSLLSVTRDTTAWARWIREAVKKLFKRPRRGGHHLSQLGK